METKVQNFTNSKAYAEVETGIPMDYYQNVDDNFGNPRTELQQIILNFKCEGEGKFSLKFNLSISQILLGKMDSSSGRGD